MSGAGNDFVVIDNRKGMLPEPLEALSRAMCRRRKSVGADGLIVVTEWNEFRSPDFVELKNTLNTPVIFDGRNLYDPDYLRQLGFSYYAIGRSA